jgi:hypothetical protein
VATHSSSYGLCEKTKDPVETRTAPSHHHHRHQHRCCLNRELFGGGQHGAHDREALRLDLYTGARWVGQQQHHGIGWTQQRMRCRDWTLPSMPTLANQTRQPRTKTSSLCREEQGVLARSNLAPLPKVLISLSFSPLPCFWRAFPLR